MEEIDSEFVLYNGRVVGPNEIRKIRNDDYRRIAELFKKKGKRLTYNSFRKIVTVKDLTTGDEITVHVGKAHKITAHNSTKTYRRDKKHGKSATRRRPKGRAFNAVGPINAAKEAEIRAIKNRLRALRLVERLKKKALLEAAAGGAGAAGSPSRSTSSSRSGSSHSNNNMNELIAGLGDMRVEEVESEIAKLEKALAQMGL